MGDRARIVFTDGNEVSPVIYLHWHGSQVTYLLEQLRDLMATRGPDLAYAAARFVGIVHATIPDENLSLGISNASDDLRAAVLEGKRCELEQASYGDAGFIVVDVNDYGFEAYGGYLAGGWYE